MEVYLSSPPETCATLPIFFLTATVIAQLPHKNG